MDRYIGATVLQAVALVLLCLLTVVTLFTVVDELRDATPGYTARHALLYVFYTTGRRLFELLPYAVFMGALVGLGLLASHAELTVLRAAGVSVGRLFGAAAAPALLLLVGNQLIGEFVAPAGEAAAGMMKLHVQRGTDDHYIAATQWHRQGGLYTSIDGYGKDGELIGIHQYEIDAGRLTFSRRAQRAVYKAESGHWLLEDVVETRFAGDLATTRRWPTLAWRSDADPQQLSAKALFDPAKLSFAELRFQIAYMRREGLDPTRYEVAFWGKALQPLAVLGLVLLAVGFVVGPLREAGMGARLTVGIAVGLAFKYLLDVLAPMSIVFAIPPALAMAVPVAICWLTGAALVRRV